MKLQFIKLPNNDVYSVRSHGGVEIGNIYKEVDGYYVFELVITSYTARGYWSEHTLREIADKLRELNKEWDEQVARDLSATP